MNTLVIPDVHLKPWMFQRASELMKENQITQAVCLMDIPDDWNQQFNLDLYAQTFDAALSFAAEHVNTLWCYGNHDLCYLWNQRESGYSPMAQLIVCEKLRKLRESLPNDNQLAYIHRIDNVLCSHGGLSDSFVKQFVPSKYYNDIDAVVEKINELGTRELWTDNSPIWCRPQYGEKRMYKPRKLMQVVGHTPMKKITKQRNVISCDVFSTYSNGEPIGTQEFLIIDTITGEFSGAK